MPQDAYAAHGRFRVDAELGRGGMGTVYAVTDTASGERLALKRLHATTNRRRDDEQLHHEHALLAELSHPSIIRVYDYGLDAAGPYYTMELLEGASLSERGQLHWREACRLLRDVASSLAVMHARKLVHRDVTLRNLQCTPEGRCKLLDFGAVARMGLPLRPVGTPPYLAPEALREEELDGRSDLFALGAALYCLLTGQHAYPASSFEQLDALWSESVREPRACVPEIPLAVSQLTMALLSLDPMARPHSAAEVMERLSALSGTDLREAGEARRAFLATPVLVGRARAVHQLRFFLRQPSALRPSVLAIHGAVGSGRTRMLEVGVREAQLAGIATLQARGTDPQRAYGLLRSLTEAARAVLPGADEASEALDALLANIEVATRGAELLARRRGLQREAVRCYRTLAMRRTLLLAVDDLDRADEASVACLAAMCEEIRDKRLLLAVATASDLPAYARAVEWLCRESTRIELPSLSRDQVLALLTSVFGDIPNVATLADRIHSISNGQPRWVMELAEYLVECGTVRYEAGAFIVPPRFGIDRLPQSLEAARQTRLETLSEPARELAYGLMLAPDTGFDPSELSAACELPRSHIERCIEELTVRGVLAHEHERVGLTHRVGFGHSPADSDASLREKWHRRLATVFERRGDAPRRAQHLWKAGDQSAAVSVLAEFCETLYRQANLDPAAIDRAIATMPGNFMELLCAVIDAGISLGFPKRAEMALRFTTVRIGALTCDARALGQLRAMFEHLRREAGLDDWDALSHIADPAERITRALAQAQARYEQTPEHDRAYPVREAIRVLAGGRGNAAGLCSQMRDFEIAASLPSIAPLSTLAPTLAMVQQVIDTTEDMMSGRYQQAKAGYLRILDLVDNEPSGPIDAVPKRFNRLGAYHSLGTLAAERGQREALTWASKLESELLFEVPAWRIRMAYYRAHGNVVEMERCRRQAELLRIAQRPHEHWGIGAITSELFHCLAWEDLIGIKRVRDELESTTQRVPAWAPVLEIARGEYARLLGEPDVALACFEKAIAGCTCGVDGMWQISAAAALNALRELGRLEEGRARGRAWLSRAEREDLRDSVSPLLQRLALIEAQLGDAGQAVEHADRAVRWLEELDITGTRAGLAHETRARVALLLQDQEGFERHLAQCARFFRAGGNPALFARYERIIRDARAAGMHVEPTGAAAVSGEAQPLDVAALRTRLQECASPEQRAAEILKLLASDAGSNVGALYVVDGGRMQLRAVLGDAHFRPEIGLEMARSWTTPQITYVAPRTRGVVTREEQTLESPPPTAANSSRSFVLIHDLEGESVIVGIALLLGGNAGTRRRGPQLPELCAQLLLEAGDATPASWEKVG